MKGDVVLAHELYQLNIVRILPPLLPELAIQVATVGVVFGNGHISWAGIEPAALGSQPFFHHSEDGSGKQYSTRPL